MDAFLTHTPLRVEEKIDGANLGISIENFELRFQNRSHYVNSATATQFSMLDAWAKEHSRELYEFLAPTTSDDGAVVTKRILFGEWMYARHSVPYTRLPGYFIAFDVHENGQLLSVKRRNELLSGTTIPVIHSVAEPGAYTLDQLFELLRGTRSAYGDELIEGLYLKFDGESAANDDDDAPQVNVDRAKIVRADFIQQITTHWTKQTLVKNKLAW